MKVKIAIIDLLFATFVFAIVLSFLVTLGTGSSFSRTILVVLFAASSVLVYVWTRSIRFMIGLKASEKNRLFTKLLKSRGGYAFVPMSLATFCSFLCVRLWVITSKSISSGIMAAVFMGFAVSFMTDLTIQSFSHVKEDNWCQP